MNPTDIAPKVPLVSFKRTKIVATVGPASSSYEIILELIKSGANGLRLNFSYEEDRVQQISWIREASKELGKPVAIIQDLQGPKIRLGDFEGVVPVQRGQSLLFRHKADYKREGVLPIQYDLSTKIQRGQRMFLYDGKVIVEVSAIKDKTIYTRAQNEGFLIARKGINLPDTDFAGDILTKKDKADIAFGVEQKVDYIALSFVQSASDVKYLRRQVNNLGSETKIIAKIETSAAVDNLEEIIQEADATMVARGDLAVEIGLEKVPIVQRKIINLGLKYGRPSIVATQMLASMAESPNPTRAEVSDVATAVLIGTDAMMLSDETAAGKDPVRVVKTMKKIIRCAENSSCMREFRCYDDDLKLNAQDAICKSVINLANSLEAVAIVADTKSGATAIKIASRRPKQPVIAITNSQKVAQQLAILYGCKAFVRPDSYVQSTRLTEWLKEHRVLKKGDVIVSVSGRHPGVVGATDTIKVRVL